MKRIPSAEVVEQCMRAIRAHAPALRVPLPPLDAREETRDGQRWIYIEDSVAATGAEGTIYWTFVVTLDAQNAVVRTTHFRSRIGRNGERDTLPPGDLDD